MNKIFFCPHLSAKHFKQHCTQQSFQTNIVTQQSLDLKRLLYTRGGLGGSDVAEQAKHI
jgi:hypothetical protein